MSNVLESRNEFLTGLSLSEISFIFFMLLVLISLFSIDDYKKNRTTGSFVLVDEATNVTVAAGMVRS